LAAWSLLSLVHEHAPTFMTKGNGALRHQAEKFRTPSRIAVRHVARLGQTPKDLVLRSLEFPRALLSGDPALVRHHQSVALRAPGRATVAMIGPRPEDPRLCILGGLCVTAQGHLDGPLVRPAYHLELNCAASGRQRVEQVI